MNKRKKRSRMKMNLPEKIGVSLIVLFLTLLACSFLLPFIYMFSMSLSSEYGLAQYGVTLIPKAFSFEAYQFMFRYSDQLIRSYVNTIIIASATTILMILVTSMFAYPVSKKDLPGRKWIMMYVLFSMLFGGGLIPFYLAVTKWYNLSGTWFAIILPGCFGAWGLILMRNYFSTLPPSLEESAFIDGAGYFTILFRIVIPLSKPIIATLSLFQIVGIWNNWFSAMLFLSRQRSLWPIMMFLKVVMESVNPSTTMGMPTGGSFPPIESLKMATVILCIAPVLITYPFLQKYFVKGILIGSIKG